MLNQFKTVGLLGLLTGLMLWIGSLWGQQGLTFAIIISVVMNIGSYWYSDTIVLKMYRAQPADDQQLKKMVKRLADQANLPMPDVYIIPSDQPNAFATGRNPDNAAVAFTKGILSMLDQDELEGVTAHELAHIKNRDTLIQTVAATIAGVISYVAMMARWGAMFGLGGRDRNGNILELLALAIVTPLLATIIKLAISRSREYLADKTGAEIAGSSTGLAKALGKMDRATKQTPMQFGHQSTGELFIVNPFSGATFSKLFSTHPPTEDRIARLQRL